MGNRPEHVSKVPGMVLIKHYNVTNHIKIMRAKAIHIYYSLISPSRKPCSSSFRCPRLRLSHNHVVLVSAGAAVMPQLAGEQSISRPCPVIVARPQVPLDAGRSQQSVA